MSGKNKFGIAAPETKSLGGARRRAPGPMGTAVRETAENLQESTEAKVEQRRMNAADAKEYRAAQAEGRVLTSLPLKDVSTDDLPRDRLDLEAVASSDEMDELVSSIRARGQKEPIEVYLDASGGYQLKKGWRRLTALRRLFDEASDDQFATVVARISVMSDDRMALYIDMVEENVIREDLTFAEMAQLAITAAADEALEGQGADQLVGRLYGSLHKMKRSYIRSFVFLLEELGDALQWPKDVSRNLGVNVARRLKAEPEMGDDLRNTLRSSQNGAAQLLALSTFLEVAETAKPSKAKPARQKFEFHVGGTKVTARNGECRFVDTRDYTQVPKDQLERGIRAFQDALDDDGNPRVTTL